MKIGPRNRPDFLLEQALDWSNGSALPGYRLTVLENFAVTSCLPNILILQL